MLEPAVLCRRVALSTVAAAAVAGCAGDTAIVLSIHTSDATAATRLEVYVGVGAAEVPTARPGSVVTPTWWRRAPLELDAAALTFPDGFGDGTHEVALYPSSEISLDDELVFAVGAWTLTGDPADPGEALVGFAHATSPTRFVDGEIRRFDVVLVAADDDHGVTRTGCAWWRADPTDPVPGPIRDRAIVPPTDADCDTFPAPTGGAAPDCRPDLAIDCDDRRPDVFPSDDASAQDCSIDDTDCCSTTVANTADVDGDGVKVCAGDCLDEGEVHDLFGQVVMAGDIHPGVTDTTCNGVDEACAIPRGGRCDLRDLDLDGDEFITCMGPDGTVGAVNLKTCARYPGQRDCLEEGSVIGRGNDANDTFTIEAKDIHPTAADIECDGVDQDCNRQCDDGGPADADGDGFARCARTGAPAPGAPVCVNFSDGVDCADSDFYGRPRPAIEACDGIDSGCDGVPAPATGGGACLPVTTVGSVCEPGVVTCTETFDGNATQGCVAISGGVTLPPLACTPCPTGGTPLNCTDNRFPTCAARTPTDAPGPACTNPPQDRDLAPCPNGTCTWNVVGGQQAGGWRVVLVDGATGMAASGPTLVGTSAALRVVGAGDMPQGFIVRRAGVPDFFEVTVFQRTTGCAEMTCTGLN